MDSEYALNYGVSQYSESTLEFRVPGVLGPGASNQEKSMTGCLGETSEQDSKCYPHVSQGRHNEPNLPWIVL